MSHYNENNFKYNRLRMKLYKKKFKNNNNKVKEIEGILDEYKKM